MVQLTGYEQQDFNTYRPSRKRWIFAIVLVFALAIMGFALGSSSNEIEVSGEPAPFWQRVAGIFTFDEEEDPDYIMPEKELDRLDVLILGVRGENDPEAEGAGALLTDTIMVFSFDKKTKKASIVSIPRDLYVKMDRTATKINAVYENKGLKYTKELVSKIAGIYVDKAVVLDFASFEEIIDQVGGIEIILAKPFEEKQQWGYGFYLPAGENHLNGKDALYYARSRFSSSDFDRSRRQQEVMFALKNKLTEHSWWTDPLKTLDIVTTINSNIKTDFNIWNAKELLDLGNEVSTADKIVKHVVSTDNLVYESRSNGAYILLPVGDNFSGLKQLFQTIIQ